jgi:hypothetical protein
VSPSEGGCRKAGRGARRVASGIPARPWPASGSRGMI